MLRLFLFVCNLITLQSLAYTPVGGTVSRGAGNTGVASVEAGDMIYLNPALIAHLRGFHFDVDYNRMKTEANDKVQTQWGVTLLENTDLSLFPSSFAYRSSRDLKETRLAVGNFIMQTFTMGIGLNYQHLILDDKHYYQTGFDLGFVYTATDHLGLGVAFYNAGFQGKNIPAAVKLSPAASLGLNYIYEQFVRFRAEALFRDDEDEPVGKFGLESFLSSWVALRLGYMSDSNVKPQQNIYTAGIGFLGPRFHINYAYQVDSKESSNNTHSIDFNLPF